MARRKWLSWLVLAAVLAVGLLSVSPIKAADPADAACPGEVMVHAGAYSAPETVVPGTSITQTAEDQVHFHFYGFPLGKTVRLQVRIAPNPPSDANFTIDKEDYWFQGPLFNTPVLLIYDFETDCHPFRPENQRPRVAIYGAEYIPPDPTPTPVPNATPVPTATPVPSDIRSNVSVRCHGCWGSSAALRVGGTEQPALPLTADAWGVPAAHYILWNMVPWEVTARVSLPEGLDPARWKLAVWQSGEVEWADELTRTAIPGSTVRFEFQLIDTAGWEYGG